MKPAIAAVLIFGVALGCRGTAAEPAYEDWYPSDIAPPEGTSYHCALTALPRELPGIPSTDRRFINHSYSMVLKATRAKLVLLNALAGEGPYDAALGQYLKATDDARDRIEAEAVPNGLETFADDILAALAGQQAFFKAAAQDRAKGASMADVYRHPEGRRASARLFSAWALMQKRYPSWSAAMRESIYHHLCALDLF